MSDGRQEQLYMSTRLTYPSTAVVKTPGGWGNQAGHLAFSQIPLIIGLAGKNNVISCGFTSVLAFDQILILSPSPFVSPDWNRIRKAQLPPPDCRTSDLVPLLDPRPGPVFERVRQRTDNGDRHSPDNSSTCIRYHGGFVHELKEENYLRWVSLPVIHRDADYRI